MPEKLLTIEEVSALMGISEEELTRLVEKGELPAYKVGGRFLRFRKEQVEAIQNEIEAKKSGKAPNIPPKAHLKRDHDAAYEQSPMDALSDFFYFNDFYIISAIISIIILLVIFKI